MYLDKHLQPTTQQQPLKGQEANNAGGYSWVLGKLDTLKRFLILGTEGGTYYATERTLTLENIGVLDALVTGEEREALQAVELIALISEQGRAPKNDPALFALAYLAQKGKDDTRRAARRALPRVARTGTHLMHFVNFANKLGGWGRGIRRAVAEWFTTKSPDSLAYQAVKYQARDGWSLRDVARLAHPKPDNDPQNAALAWIAGKDKEILRPFRPAIIDAFEEAKTASPGRVIQLINERGLPREAIPTEMLNDPAVWHALLGVGTMKRSMPVTALVRNLATMTRIGAIGWSGATYAALSKALLTLHDEHAIRESKIHPIQVLMALKTYAAGRGLKSQHTWTPIQSVVDALDSAFYSSFANVEPAGKRTILGIDISGSMWSGDVGGVSGFHPAMAAGAMAVVTMASEPMCEAYGFTTGSGGFWRTNTVFEPIALSPRRRLDDNLKTMHDMSQRMGGTDCGLPIEWAINNKREVDTFVVYTDNETYAPKRHPSEALKDYRRRFNAKAKLVVVGLTATKFTIADPEDPGSLDVVGFDASAPQLINDFARD